MAKVSNETLLVAQLFAEKMKAQKLLLGSLKEREGTAPFVCEGIVFAEKALASIVKSLNPPSAAAKYG